MTNGGIVDDKNPSNSSNPALPSTPANIKPAGSQKNPASPASIAAMYHRISAYADAMREAITSIDSKAARKVWDKVKDSKAQTDELKKELGDEDNLNVRLLLNTGFVKGQQVKYVGTKFADQYAGVELTVNDIRDRNGITCKKPDGSYTTDLDKEDLMKL